MNHVETTTISDDFEEKPNNTAVPQKRKYNKSRLSLTKHHDHSLDVISRYGRARKPKVGDDNFLPTEIVLGKSPRSPKKEKKQNILNKLTSNSEPISDDVFSDVAYIRDCSSMLSQSISSGSSPEQEEKSPSHHINNNSLENSFVEEVNTEYEPGDLIWGKIGHHPFWPCIIINDPEFKIFYKTTGHKRLMYHVLFYGDNGKRSWVQSSCVFRFLGLQDFLDQSSLITPEIKKNNPKYFSGFSIKQNKKQKWECAVLEAETAMPMTRDERVDAFLKSFPSKQVKGTKKSRDDTSSDADSKEASSTDASPNKVLKLSTPRQKKVLITTLADSTPPEKRKRGRPRKSEQVVPAENDISSSKEDVPRLTAKHTIKHYMQDGDILGVVYFDEIEEEEEEEGDDDDDSEIPIVDIIMADKSAADIAWRNFRDWYSPHLAGHISDDLSNETETIALQEWNTLDNKEKARFVPNDVRGPIRAKEEAEREARKISKNQRHDFDSSDEEGKEDDDGAGVEEEVATVGATDTEKISTVVTISKKKVNLFRGYRLEKVCQVCEKPGNTVKCRGPCSGTFHVECARGADNSEGTISLVNDKDEKPKKRGRKRKIDSVSNKETPKIKTVPRSKKIYAEEETDSDLDYNCGDDFNLDDPSSVMSMILGDQCAALPEVSLLVEQDSEEEEEDCIPSDPISSTTDGKLHVGDFRCGDCAVLRTPLCFACGQATDPSGLDSTRHRCSTGHCGKHFHKECLKMWPQGSHGYRKGVIHNLTCPQHVCHTCISDNPRDGIGRFSHEKLVRCIRCPTTYHYGNYCVPAGSEILTATQMICPRHYDPPKKGTNHVNTSWCFICSMGGSLICCDLCPSSIHVECLKIKPPQGGYICEDCETGRFPLYNEVLWVKLGNWRWWPALTLFPSEVPDNVKNKPHRLGEFAVRFLGTNDHYWTHRGRCFVFHEGDAVVDCKKTSKSNMESSYLQGVKEANNLHKAHKELRAKLQLQAKPCSMKPPQYIKIKTNKPIGKVKFVEFDASNIAPCECNPNSAHPCSPDSDCVNRLLMQECDPNICPAGDKCENQFFEKRIYPALEPYRTEHRGWGLKTLVDIKKGSFVIEYVGEVIDDEEYQRRVQKKHDEKDENYYFLTIDAFRIIDAGPKGNVSRFMNHSCQPNCVTQKWNVGGDTRIGLFALHDIRADTELTFNYNLESKGNEKKPCMCGAHVCSGFIGVKKKVFQPEVKTTPLSGKKKRRKPRVRNLIEDICLMCNLGTEKGVLITCCSKQCATRYHLTCIGLNSSPPGKWFCGRHKCNMCEKRALQWCSYCTDSYCPVHLGDLLVNDPLHGYICETHQKNPTSVNDHKKKREDERKQKEEEKRKRDEEERAQRCSRRGRNTCDEVVTKKYQVFSDKEDSETSSKDLNEDKFAVTPKIGREEYHSKLDQVKSKGKVDITSPSEVKEEENVAMKRTWKRKSSANKSNFKFSKPDHSLHLISDGQDLKNFKSYDTPSPVDCQPTKLKFNKKARKIDNNINENLSKNGPSSQFAAVKAEVTVKINSENLNYQSDADKDEVPGADPLLDKFIIKEREPMDDQDTEPYENKQEDTLLTAQTNSIPKLHTSPSPSKKRRKHSPVSNQDYIKIGKKPLRRMDDSMKGNLSYELQDIAMTFASDDGLESPELEMKSKGLGHKRGRGRRSLGVARPRVVKTTFTHGYEPSGAYVNITMSPALVESHLKSPSRSLEKNMNSSPEPVESHLKSPIRSREKASIVKSPEINTPSDLFASQRAKGSKVMPPNRRLSSARGGSHKHLSREFSDSAGSPGRGLKTLKGRPPSNESSTSSNWTENRRTETVYCGGMRKTRPVLSKVEDNGVSLDEDTCEKVVGSSPTPVQKQSLPNTISNPQGKTNSTRASNKQSAKLEVSALWNQDFPFKL